MKNYANNFKTQFTEDKKLMDQLERSQEENIRKTQAENNRLAKLQK